jgi:hypothetical protein
MASARAQQIPFRNDRQNCKGNCNCNCNGECNCKGNCKAQQIPFRNYRQNCKGKGNYNGKTAVVRLLCWQAFSCGGGGFAAEDCG